ncbi:MAG: PEP-CTERM sorting domain-containing protein [Planctomycetaceae bacterium]|nr:PEP-CTERM sorting domain-containing protein [Planctomycetaceae bacterium]
MRSTMYMVAVSVCLLLAGAAHAGDYYGSQDGDWSLAATWNNAGVPGTNDGVWISGENVVHDSAASGLAGYGAVDNGSLTLQKSLNVEQWWNVNGGGVVDLNGNDLTVDGGLNFNGGSIVNSGRILVPTEHINVGGGTSIALDGDDYINRAYVYDGCTMALGSVGGNVEAGIVADYHGLVTVDPGYVTSSGFYFDVRNGGMVRITQGAGVTTGVTYAPYDDPYWRALRWAVQTGGLVELNFDSGSASGDWIFKMLDTTDTLTDMVTDGRLVITGAPYEIVNDGTWTIVRATGEIPEPATMSLLAIGSLAALIRRKR